MTIISSREVFRCPLFHITDDVALDPDGHQVRRIVVRHKGSVAVLAVDAANRVLLVRQFRLPAERMLWELPAGAIDPGEQPLEAARRELMEETGVRAARWTPLLAYNSSPGFLQEVMNVWLAKDLEFGEANLQGDERIETRWFSVAEIDAGIADGTIADGKTIAGFLAWQRYHA